MSPTARRSASARARRGPGFQPQYRRQHRGYNQGYNGQPYGNGYNQGYNGYRTARVTAITDVQRRSSGLRVTGMLDSRGGYGAYGNHGYANQGYGNPGYATRAMPTATSRPAAATSPSAATSIIAARSPTSGVRPNDQPLLKRARGALRGVPPLLVESSGWCGCALSRSLAARLERLAQQPVGGFLTPLRGVSATSTASGPSTSTLPSTALTSLGSLWIRSLFAHAP